jgi:hypothetical protein
VANETRAVLAFCESFRVTEFGIAVALIAEPISVSVAVPEVVTVLRTAAAGKTCADAEVANEFTVVVFGILSNLSGCKGWNRSRLSDWFALGSRCLR